MKSVISVLAAALIVVFAGGFTEGQAQRSSTGQLALNVTVQGSCIVTASDVQFAPYDIGAASAVNQSSELSVNCNTGLPYSVAIDGGANPGNSRRLAAAGGSFLDYQLCKDSACSNPWGDGSSFGTAYEGQGTGAADSVSVYGQIFANQSPPSGDYTDTVTITVGW
ncbi:MAG: spore coat protein U domain-containing protein [Nitrospira sp.]|nr:spore coat protein U domain-containing protein [bacterium]MBL7049714.1 spore coat protein U domain-containing protein [Nitrospira sp.]